MWVVLLGLLLTGCRCRTVERTYADVPPTGLETRFRDTPRWAPQPELAFAIRDRCPRIVTARATRETAGIHLVEVRGERLDLVERVGVLLDDDRLADAQLVRAEDGSLTFPLACSDCQVILGIDAGEGRHAACTGPGRSLQFRRGRLQRLSGAPQ